MDDRSKLIIGGLIIAFVFVAVGVVLFGFANETLDEIARLFGAPEWEIWFPPLPDYEVPGFEGNTLASFLLGIGFTGLVLVATFVIMRLLTRRPQARGKASTDSFPPSS
jgi:hypothetical protein